MIILFIQIPLPDYSIFTTTVMASSIYFIPAKGHGIV